MDDTFPCVVYRFYVIKILRHWLPVKDLRAMIYKLLPFANAVKRKPGYVVHVDASYFVDKWQQKLIEDALRYLGCYGFYKFSDWKIKRK